MCERFPGYTFATLADLSVIQFVQMAAYLKDHPVTQAEMVEVKRGPGAMPPPTDSPSPKGVETTHETKEAKTVAELASILDGV